MKKVVIDTDIGDDIDDAFALALAATLKKTEIVGITNRIPQYCGQGATDGEIAFRHRERRARLRGRKIPL